MYWFSRLDRKEKKLNKWFHYAASVALNYKQIESHPERVSKVKSFINKSNWKGINCPSKIDNWKTFEKNNPTIERQRNMSSLDLKN